MKSSAQFLKGPELILHALTLLAIAPQLHGGRFDDNLAGWTVHRHGQRAADPSVRAANHALSIAPRGPGRAGVSQTVYLTPGSLWRLSARTTGSALIEAETPSGNFGSSSGRGVFVPHAFARRGHDSPG